MTTTDDAVKPEENGMKRALSPGTPVKKLLPCCAVVLLIYSAAAVITSYPMPLRIHTFLPGGYGDPCFTLWTLGWDFRHFSSLDFATYWDGNIFYPYPRAASYSDPLFGVAIVAYPIYLVTRELIMTANIFYMLTFVLSAFFTFLLVWYLTGDRYAAIVSGFIFSFNPFRMTQLGHIQILAMMWMPLILLVLYLIRDRRKIAYWPLFMALFILNALTSGYHGVFFSMLTAVYALWLLLSRQACWRFMAGLVISVTLCLLIMMPLYNSISMTKSDSQWQLEFVRSQSPGLHNFIEADPHNICYGEILRSSGELVFYKALFPGFIPVILTAVCVWCRYGSRGFNGRDLPFYLFVIVGSLVLSVGPSLRLFGNDVTMPYMYLFDHVPGFKSLRYSNRIMECAMLGMAVLSGYALAHLGPKLSGRLRYTCLVLLSLCVVAEGLSIPLKGVSLPYEKTVPAVYQWLRRAPDAPVIEYPMSPEAINSLNTEYMYYSTFHWKRLVNGASNRKPPGYESLISELQLFPAGQALDRLAGTGVRYIVVHMSRYREAEAQAMLDLLQSRADILTRVYMDDRDAVYELGGKTEGQRPAR